MKVASIRYNTAVSMTERKLQVGKKGNAGQMPGQRASKLESGRSTPEGANGSDHEIKPEQTLLRGWSSLLKLFFFFPQILGTC